MNKFIINLIIGIDETIVINPSIPIYELKYSNVTEFVSLKEAESHIMEYADKWCPNGTCTILEVDENSKVLLTRRYWKGKLYWSGNK